MIADAPHCRDACVPPAYVPTDRPVVVVGGGVIGLSIAWQLLRSGYSCCLLESKTAGSATSSAAAGILPAANEVSGDSLELLRGYSHRLFDDWARQLESISGIDIGYRDCGGWYVADTIGEWASMTATETDWKERGIEFQKFDPPQLSSSGLPLSPTRMKQLRAAWFCPDDRQIHPRRYVAALAAAVVQSGGLLREHETVTDIKPLGAPEGPAAAAEGRGRWEIMVDDRSRSIVCDTVVVCGGVLLGRIAAAMRLTDSVVPIRGQILCLQRSAGDPRRDQPSIVNVGNRYIVSRDDGTVLVGSCEQEAGFDLSTEPQMIDQLRRFAIELQPELAHATERDRWSGLRPMTFDGFPMIGPLPDWPGVYVAGGHYRSGIHFSPATAMLISDAIAGRPPAIDITAFAVKQDLTQGMI